MKPREERGVVDSKLNVYGVRGLKVAGMPFSICYDAWFSADHGESS